MDDKRVVAFRIHYADGDILEGSYYVDWIRAPHKDVEGVEFYYDDWDENNEPRREYQMQQGEYTYPNLPHGKPGTNTGRKTAKRLKQHELGKPSNINPANRKEETHTQPTNYQKGS